MSGGLDRKEYLRRDCSACAGAGHFVRGGEEVPCEACGGSGMEEKEVPFKFDGPRSQQEIEDIWNEEN